MISSPLDRAIYHRIKKQICKNSSFKEWTREEAKLSLKNRMIKECKFSAKYYFQK